MSFLTIPLTFLYGEYIDRPSLPEQKNSYEYIVPPRTRREKNTKIQKLTLRKTLMKTHFFQQTNHQWRHNIKKYKLLFET